MGSINDPKNNKNQTHTAKETLLGAKGIGITNGTHSQEAMREYHFNYGDSDPPRVLLMTDEVIIPAKTEVNRTLVTVY